MPPILGVLTRRPFVICSILAAALLMHIRERREAARRLLVAHLSIVVVPQQVVQLIVRAGRAGAFERSLGHADEHGADRWIPHLARQFQALARNLPMVFGTIGQRPRSPLARAQ